MDQPEDTPSPESIPIALRAFIGYPETARKPRRKPTPPSEWTLVFDAETRTDAAQLLRFGAYEVRRGGDLDRRGLFYNASGLTSRELRLLRRYAEHRKEVELLPVETFIEDVFFRYGYDFHGSIVGFNLPFDLSRLAYKHSSARGRAMSGGFSLALSPRRYRPRVQVKHRSRRSSFMQFAATAEQRFARSTRKWRPARNVERGHFFDVRTIAAALTSESHSLESLSDFLEIPHPKRKSDDHGKTLTTKYIEYALRDATATWECFTKLRDRYDSLGLTETPLNNIQSEAGIGKAYLRQMNIRPWRRVQAKFPRALVGHIMSAYFGGRAEMHIRRSVVQVSYHDFASMYPSVCTLMSLWRFVIANGVTSHSSTAETKSFLERLSLAEIQQKEFWPQLTTLVQIKPDKDILPVRGKYDGNVQHTIGLNYLTSEEPLWFVLADCVASKILTGQPPKILRAITFEPTSRQSGLLPIDVMGKQDYRIDPRTDDFYRTVIDLRAATRAAANGATGRRKSQLEVEQNLLKIIANATSYGIFMELNPEQSAKKEAAMVHAVRPEGVPWLSRKAEKPGEYFHPLLAALITGAARLMLAINEKLAVDTGLDWAFCDTDSMALARPNGMSDSQFFRKAEAIRDWFRPLNPYAEPGPLLKLEDENRPLKGPKLQVPLSLYGVSAKRYALFNLKLAKPVFRKISVHGLGQYLGPYEDDKAPSEFSKPRVPLSALKARRWQHDLWFRAVVAAMAGNDNGNPASHQAFRGPAASRYHATKPRILRWFSRYNKSRSYAKQVKPFNFLLAFQPNFDSVFDAVNEDQKSSRAIEFDPRTIPKPVAAYDRNTAKAALSAFDRFTGKPVRRSHLMTYSEALADYFIHPESKFLNGREFDRGITTRRHIKVDITNIFRVGKEANDADEQMALGYDDEAILDLEQEPEALAATLEWIRRTDGEFRRRPLSKAAGVSARQITNIVGGNVRFIRQRTIEKLRLGAAKLAANRKTLKVRETEFLKWANHERSRIGLVELARQLRCDPANLAKVLDGKRRPTEALMRAAYHHTKEPDGNGTP